MRRPVAGTLTIDGPAGSRLSALRDDDPLIARLKSFQLRLAT
jgi:hypothetical protein